MSEKTDIRKIIKGELCAVKDYKSQIFDSENNHILDIRGWGRFSSQNNDMEAIKLQDAVSDFIIEAVNEKLKTLKDKCEVHKDEMS